MKIVKESPHDRVFTGSCLSCEAVMECTEKELQINIENEDFSRSDKDESIPTDCHSCGHKGSVIFKPKQSTYEDNELLVL